MPKFANREEYEAWKDGKIIESRYSATGAQNTEVSRQSNSGLFIGVIFFAVVVLSGAYIYLEKFQTKVVWTGTSYTNSSLGFSIDMPEGWKEFKFRPELKKQIEAFTPAGAKTLFTVSHNNSENTVYEIIDMQKVIPPDREDVNDIIDAEIKKLESMLTSLGYETSLFTLTIDGLDARFLQANLGSSIFVTGIILKPQEHILMYQFYDLMGKTEQQFWRSARSLRFIDS